MNDIGFTNDNILSYHFVYLQEAETSFLRALESDPSSCSYHANIGVLYHRWKKLKKAEFHYQKALEINPTHKTTLDNLQKLKNVKQKQANSKL